MWGEKQPILSGTMCLAICKALGIDYKKTPVSSVKVNLEAKSIATVSVDFVLEIETVTSLAKILQEGK